MAEKIDRCFGQPEGIEKRLAMWANRFSMDKTYPWVGLGVIDDLECASRMLGGEPGKKYPDMRKNPPPEPKPAAPVEYDL